mmetsp:Transcript_599/g.655  ORF Transcript_599/g.655 Transcript_599/m.655 type:complete len:416 (+) Transcript_599:491-1738(+)
MVKTKEDFILSGYSYLRSGKYVEALDAFQEASALGLQTAAALGELRVHALRKNLKAASEIKTGEGQEFWFEQGVAAIQFWNRGDEESDDMFKIITQKLNSGGAKTAFQTYLGDLRDIPWNSRANPDRFGPLPLDRKSTAGAELRDQIKTDLGDYRINFLERNHLLVLIEEGIDEYFKTSFVILQRESYDETKAQATRNQERRWTSELGQLKRLTEDKWTTFRDTVVGQLVWKYPDLAIERFTQAIEASPSTPQYWLHRAHAQFHRGNLTDALKDATAAIKLGQLDLSIFLTRDAYLHLGGRQSDSELDETRQTILVACTKLKQKRTSVFQDKEDKESVKVLYSLKKYNEVIDLCDKLLIEDPENTTIKLTKAKALDHLGLLPMALEYYEKATPATIDLLIRRVAEKGQPEGETRR